MVDPVLIALDLQGPGSSPALTASWNCALGSHEFKSLATLVNSQVAEVSRDRSLIIAWGWGKGSFDFKENKRGDQS